MPKLQQASPDRLRSTRLTPIAIAAALILPGIAFGDDQAFIHTTDSAELEWGSCPEFMPEGCAIAVLQGNPAEPNADVFFRMAGNSTVPSHTHTSAERMVLVTGELEVEYEGHAAEVLTPGTYAYGPPELAHSATCRSDEDCVLFIAFEEPVDAMPAE